MKIAFHMGYASLGSNNYGSEIALLNLAKQFQKYFHVTIYSTNCVEDAIIEGLVYKRPDAIIKDDILIISRYLNVFIDHTILARKTYIWVHDITFQPYYNGQQMRDNGAHLFRNIEHKIDGIIVLTEFHKQIVKQIYDIEDSKIHVIGNAISTEKFNKEVKKNRNKFIYTSCPKRGLDLLLKLFPDIHSEFPETELYIYRGGESFSKQQLDTIAQYPYIHYLGAKPNEFIAEEFLSSGIWLYPTDFIETYCISALEAQMAGCMCITGQIGSLPEIVGNRGVVIGDHYGSPQYNEAIMKSVRVFLKTDLYDNKIKKGKEWARQQRWENICDKWMKILNLEIDIPVYVINLKDQTEKWEECCKRLNGVGLQYERFNAINGCDLEWGNELQKYFILREDSYRYIPFNNNTGIFGCAMSHVRLWEKLADMPDNTVWMVAEDDVYFEENFKSEWDGIYKSIKNDQDWDMIYLGYTFLGDKILETDKKITERVYELVKSEKRQNCGGTFCYVMRAKCAKKLLNEIKERKIDRAIDWFMIDSYDKIKAYICYPLMVSHRTTCSAVQGNQKTLRGLPPPFDFVDKIVYINLDMRQDRNEEIMRELCNVNQSKIIRFQAIKEDQGFIGCTKSHIEVLKMAIQNNWNSYLVLEDDMIWNNFKEGYERFMTLPKKYDVIMLGSYSATIGENSRLLKGQGTQAYIVSKNYYPILLANMEEGLENLIKTLDYPSYAIDIGFNKLQARDEWFVVTPPLCVQRAGYSDIEKRNVDYRGLINKTNIDNAITNANV